MDNTSDMTKKLLPRLMKPAQVAEILAVSRTAVYRLLQSGELPSIRFAGFTVRVQEDDLVKFIQNHRHGTK